jgi:hypothetical protein
MRQWQQVLALKDVGYSFFARFFYYSYMPLIIFLGNTS